MSHPVPNFPPEYDFLVHCCAAISREDYRTALESLKKGFNRNLEAFEQIDGVTLMKDLQRVIRVLESKLRQAYGYDWEHNIDVPRVAESGKRLRCSFCGKRQSEVDKVVSGGPVGICNECVQVCNEILQDAKA